MTKLLNLTDLPCAGQPGHCHGLSLCSWSLTKAKSESQVMTDPFPHTSIGMYPKCRGTHSTVIHFLLEASHNHISTTLPEYMALLRDSGVHISYHQSRETYYECPT